jgi:hypothetical protein
MSSDKVIHDRGSPKVKLIWCLSTLLLIGSVLFLPGCVGDSDVVTTVQTTATSTPKVDKYITATPTLKTNLTTHTLAPTRAPVLSTPTPPPKIRFFKVASGTNHACAIDHRGAITCQGFDSHGQVSEHPDSAGFNAVTVGVNHSCALDHDGTNSLLGFR